MIYLVFPHTSLNKGGFASRLIIELTWYLIGGSYSSSNCRLTRAGKPFLNVWYVAILMRYYFPNGFRGGGAQPTIINNTTEDIR